jgi:hypothetical protein
MADLCCFCDTRWPAGGTKHLVLNGGELWIEFCEECGERETLTNKKGETITVAALYEKAGKDNKKDGAH